MIIYKTTNLINGKWYIGQDSRDLPGYFGGGVLLKKAVKKYGRINFKKETLERLPPGSTKDDLNKAEREWIAKTNAVERSDSYNIDFGGGAIIRGPEVGKKISDATRGKKVGIKLGPRPNNSGSLWKGKRGPEHHLFGKPSSKKGIRVTEQIRVKNAIAHGAKPFLMTDKITGFSKEYLITADCARENRLCHSAISACLRGSRKSTGGFYFKYKDIGVCP
jgi:group I intron endonuclease